MRLSLSHAENALLGGLFAGVIVNEIVIEIFEVVVLLWCVDSFVCFVFHIIVLFTCCAYISKRSFVNNFIIFTKSETI